MTLSVDPNLNLGSSTPGNPGDLHLFNNTGAETITLHGNDNDAGSRLSMFNGISALSTVELMSISQPTYGNGSPGIGGEVAVVNAQDPVSRAEMFIGADGLPRIMMYNPSLGSRTESVNIHIAADNSGGGFIGLHENVNGQATIRLLAGQSRITVANGQLPYQETITLNGATGCVVATTINATPGSCDLAEAFDHSDPTAAQPGMVLVMDPANAGKLTVSTQAYDKKVAGIVSGAGGLRPGMVLGGGDPSRPRERSDRDPSARADGSDSAGLPLALAGRVYCYVDATENAVEVGDLLTTSDTPGYAMKAADPARAFGAVLGKAMEPLAQGEQGLILVLVSLQ